MGNKTQNKWIKNNYGKQSKMNIKNNNVSDNNEDDSRDDDNSKEN